MEGHPNPIQYLQDTLNVGLKQIFTGKAAHLSGKFALIVKRKPNNLGDIHFPAFGRRIKSLEELYKDTKVDVSKDLEKILNTSTILIYVKDFNFSPSTGQLNFKLDRIRITKDVINDVLRSGLEYGKQSSSKEILDEELELCDEKTNTFVLSNDSTIDSGEISLEYLRTVITLDHVKRLLSANGLQTQTMNSDKNLASFPDSKVISGFLLQFDESFSKAVNVPESEDDSYQKTLMDVEKMLAESDKVSRIHKSIFTNAKGTEANCVESLGKDETEVKTESEGCYLDCEELSKKYGQQKVTINKTVIQNISSLEFNAKNLQMKPSDSCRLLHVTSCNLLHRCKQNCMAWEAVSSVPFARNQAFMSLGVISVWNNGEKIEKIGSQELLRLRQEQLRSAYLLKYGDIVQGPGWEQSITAMAVVTIKLQIMAAAQNNQIKLDVSDSAQEFRQATFVMYNCARLSKLFEHYEQSVTKGLYPPLPPIEQIDFSLLRDDEEWGLLLRYVMTFPSTVRESIQGLLAKPQSGGVMTTNINKISCFLQGLSYDFSSYYRRVHVLGEPRPHLFPTMFARLYLLKAIQQVFHNGLALLDILPLTQM
ncbi:uncharacterized protein LOC116305881 [Actinia tenebrosa]|uniref:Uncharacterized protein LOC116305881 n=1 Tax=Actinia tenebrosa TaxID=6105 RepID=A0A6P8IX99_ACTTE|nr:uncharacterized protein LOC116305881 [Actinia tenebrosa]